MSSVFEWIFEVGEKLVKLVAIGRKATTVLHALASLVHFCAVFSSVACRRTLSGMAGIIQLDVHQGCWYRGRGVQQQGIQYRNVVLSCSSVMFRVLHHNDHRTTLLVLCDLLLSCPNQRDIALFAMA